MKNLNFKLFASVLTLMLIIPIISVSAKMPFDYCSTTFISILAIIMIHLTSLFLSTFCETGIPSSDHNSKQTKTLEETNKKLDNDEIQE